jgi:ABC-2 type transport system permease protein
MLGSNCGARLDVTGANLHSLSEDTERLLSELDSARPVTIEAFVSPEVPRDYVETRRDLLNLLKQYDAYGGNAIRVRVVETKRFSDEARMAEQRFDIEAQTVMEDIDGRATQRDIYMGLAFTCGLEQQVIPFLYNKLPVEYELTRSIRVVAQTERRTLGILNTDVDLFGGFNFQAGTSTPEWEIVRELRLQYEVERVNPDEDYPDDLDVLLAPMASSLMQEQMDRLSDWILAGNPVLFMDDPAPMSAPGTAPDDPKGGPRNPMMGGPPPEQKGNFDALLEKLNLRWNPYQIVWDSYNPHPELEAGIQPEIVFVGANSGATPAFNPEEEITSGLQEVVLIFAGALEEGGKPGMTFVPLLHTSQTSGYVMKHELFSRSFFGQATMNPGRRHTLSPDQVVAARVIGKAEQGGNTIHAIFIPDLDMISSSFFEFRRDDRFGFDFDNVTLVLNCVDLLAGDESFISLRKRRPKHRTLEAIAKKTKEYEEEWLTEKSRAESSAKLALATAQKQLDDKVKAVQEMTGLDEQSKAIRIESIREIEQRRLDVARAKIEDEKEQKVEEAKARRIEQQRATESVYGILGMVFSPLLAVAVGLGVFVSRRRREREAVPASRAAGGSRTPPLLPTTTPPLLPRATPPGKTEDKEDAGGEA